MIDDQRTTDTLFRGQVRLTQKRKGYRFSIDALILAHYISLKDTDIAVELGTGCGIIPIILAHRSSSVRFYGIEIQKDLAELAVKNVELNHLEDRITILHRDMKDWRSYLEPGVADLVFSNPPYRRFISGRISPDAERAVARHEIKVGLFDLVSIAANILRPSGRLVFIHSAERATDLIVEMRASQLEPKRMRLVHARNNLNAELVLIEGVKYGRPGLRISSPLFLYRADGSYTQEMTEIMEELR
ncbi:MAG: tRNA1(Val) (adenine(37)-N6)-methyltransferase [Deltaproteobacteria bacterium]|nr:tRNA1(Val) (adenine(37)-N6)-methyltransferase [Deltaproteobacteria bacterium]